MVEDERERSLRQMAEKLVGTDLASRDDLTLDQMRGLIQEFQVHQIELKMQNEELRSAQEELERFRKKYLELYDLAPAAYLTLDGDGVIVEANLKAADLLGHRRSHILRRKFKDFVRVSQLAAFGEHLRAVAKADGRRPCELELLRKDSTTVAVHLETARINVGDKEGAWEIHISITDGTERKQVEQAMRQAHERAIWLARFPEENPNPVVRVSADGHVLYRNAATAKLPEWACEVGKPLPELLLPIVARVMAAGEDAPQDVQLGGRFYSVSVTPFPQESYANVYGRDITDRKRAEEALRESEQRLNRAQEIAHLGSWELDLVNNRLTWSNEVYRMFGLKPQEFGATYEAFLEAVHPDDRAAVDAAYSSSLREGRDTYEIEHRVVRKSSGEVRLVHERCQHCRDATGRIVGSVGMVHDITERKRLEEALRTQAEQYSTIVATTSDGFWLVDDKARLLDVNEVYCRMSGYSREELLRLCVPDLEAVEQADETAHQMRTLVENGSDCFETRHRAKDGRLFDVEISTTFLGSKGWFIVFIRDITERKRAEQALRASEEALRQANEQLEGKVRERTAELRELNENLMESRDQLRSLASDLIVTEARERRALASELHDTVAQMLAIAKLTLEATGARLEGKSQEAVKRVVQLLQEASRQTRSLMADLSPALLYEAGLGQALRALARRMGELHALTVEVVDDGDPKPLGEDYRILLFRAVQELLHNTVKHAKAANVKVSLQSEGDQMRIEVEDDGVGFLSSERCRGDGKREGFGLFSLRERLGHLGGSFEVCSQPGRGVHATLIVPLQAEKGDEAEPAVIRILIADDHRMMRDALAALLEKEPGFEVVGLAEDGVDGVRLARVVKPDVVLMDIHMPRMNGIEATRRITAELPGLKVIGLSVQAEPQLASEMLAAGAWSFVPKSSSPEELTKAIRSAVGPTGET